MGTIKLFLRWLWHLDGNHDSWECDQCRGLNMSGRRRCGTCGRYGPNIVTLTEVLTAVMKAVLPTPCDECGMMNPRRKPMLTPTGEKPVTAIKHCDTCGGILEERRGEWPT